MGNRTCKCLLSDSKVAETGPAAVTLESEGLSSVSTPIGHLCLVRFVTNWEVSLMMWGNTGFRICSITDAVCVSTEML